MSEVTITPEQLNTLLICLRAILGRDPLITEVTQVLEIVSTFQKGGNAA